MRIPLLYGLGWYGQEYEGVRLVWHSGWQPEAYSAIYLKIPEIAMTLILLANTESLWWGNSLNDAEIQKSPFVMAFLDTFFGRKIH